MPEDMSVGEACLREGRSRHKRDGKLYNPKAILIIFKNYLIFCKKPVLFTGHNE